MKKYLAIFLLAGILLPIFSFAQTGPTATYNHSSVTETSAIISGKISNSGFGLGYAILFGSIPTLLLNVAPIIPDVNGNYSIEIKNLLGNSTYYYKMVYGLTATPMGPVKNFKTSASSLIINHKDVTQVGATIYGTVSPGHLPFVVKYGKTPQVKDGSFSVLIDQYGEFNEVFPSSMPPETTIYYRAADPLIPIIFYSSLKSFKTTKELVTMSLQNLSSSSVTAFGTVTNGTPAPKILIAIKGTNTFVENDPILDANNAWSATFAGLEPNTEYVIKAVQKTNPAIIYLTRQFKTASSDMQLQFFNITDASLTVSSTIPEGMSVKICFAIDEQNLTTSANCSSPITAPNYYGGFEHNVTNLAPNTVYYFVARNASTNNDLSEVFDVSTFPITTTPNDSGTNVTVEGPENLVPCDGLDCDFNKLMELANNVINFLLKTVALPLFAVIMAYVGWLYMTSAENPGNRSKAKSILINSVWGFIIAMAAFIIIKTILVSLGYEGINFMDF